jgi:hypothetical protein
MDSPVTYSIKPPSMNFPGSIGGSGAAYTDYEGSGGQNMVPGYLPSYLISGGTPKTTFPDASQLPRTRYEIESGYMRCIKMAVSSYGRKLA